jgi:hypothetical protein
MVSQNFYKKSLTKKEIFYFIGATVRDVGFSSQTEYILLKRQYNCFNLLSTNTKSVNLKIKITRSKFKIANNLAALNGFYRAIW